MAKYRRHRCLSFAVTVDGRRVTGYIRCDPELPVSDPETFAALARIVARASIAAEAQRAGKGTIDAQS